MKGKIAKKFLLIVLIMTMFTGCDSGKSTESKGEDSVSDSKKTVIVFESHVGNPEEQAPQLWEAAQAFMEENPDIEIQINGNTDVAGKVKLAAQSDTMPDIFWTYVDDAKQYIEAGQLADLSDLLSDKEYVDAFLPGAYGANLSTEGVYGLSCEMQCNCFFINEKLFSDCGLDVPETFEDLLDAAPILREKGIIPWAIGTSGDGLGITWGIIDALWYYDMGEDLDSYISEELSWNNDKMTAYFKNYENASNIGMFPEDVTTLDYYKARELFVNGQAAVFMSGVWDIPFMEESEYKDDISFWWGPTYETAPIQTQYQFVSAGYPYCVSGKLQKEEPERYEALCKFLEYYYGPESAQISADNMCIPVTTYETEIDLEEHSVFAEANESVKTADNTAPQNMEMMLGSARVSAFVEPISGVLSGIYTAEQAAEMLEAEMAVLK